MKVLSNDYGRLFMRKCLSKMKQLEKRNEKKSDTNCRATNDEKPKKKSSNFSIKIPKILEKCNSQKKHQN